MAWTIFEILINYYQGFWETYFIYKFLDKKSDKITPMMRFVCAFAIGSIITVLNYISIFEGVSSILYWVCLFVFAFLGFKDNLIKKVFASIIPLALLFLLTSINLNLISSAFGITVKDIIVEQDYRRFIALISIQLTYAVSVIIISKLFNFATEKFSFIDWLPIIIVMCVSIALVYILHYLSLTTENINRLYVNVSYIIVFSINIFMFYVIYSLFNKNQKLREYEILKIQQEYQKNYIENANTQYESIKKIRHDTRNHLLTICQLISDNEVNTAYDFAKKNIDNLELSQTFVNTQNSIVNAIINSKLTSASTIGIHVSCLSTNSFDGIDDIDLCNLLGNILDNAITACREQPENANREINVKINCEDELYYTFIVSNTILSSISKENPTLKTTKADKDNHGYGTKIIKDIADKYDGRVDFYEEYDMFCCQVNLISNTKASE
ncbi:MAG: GHKL domain-containing protein [Ruminococcus sp.]|nr:GHKL domain-containing protein [Ruminococcus sp.]